MARVTVEDCLARVPNRFALTILASRRARALGEGRGTPMVHCDNKEGVTALREISDDRVRFKEDVEETLMDFIEEQRRQLRVTAGEHTFLEAASLRALEDDEEEGEDVDEGDIEELQSDPEALSKQAKGDTEDEDEDAEEEDDEEEETEGDSDEDAVESTFSDDEEIPDDAAEVDEEETETEDDEDAGAAEVPEED